MATCCGMLLGTKCTDSPSSHQQHSGQFPPADCLSHLVSVERDTLVAAPPSQPSCVGVPPGSGVTGQGAAVSYQRPRAGVKIWTQSDSHSFLVMTYSAAWEQTVGAGVRAARDRRGLLQATPAWPTPSPDPVGSAVALVEAAHSLPGSYAEGILIWKIKFVQNKVPGGFLGLITEE